MKNKPINKPIIKMNNIALEVDMICKKEEMGNEISYYFEKEKGYMSYNINFEAKYSEVGTDQHGEIWVNIKEIDIESLNVYKVENAVLQKLLEDTPFIARGKYLN